MGSRNPAPAPVDPLDVVDALISQRFGFRSPLHRRERLEELLTERAHALGLPDLGAYATELPDRMASEQTFLVHLLTNNDSYFFREPEAIDAFFEQEIPRLSVRQPIRVLCAGCSTGEEAYSLVMAASNHPLLAGRLRVRAVDIDASCLAVARSARYPERSFRGVESATVGRYFTSEGEEWSVKMRYRSAVEFSFANILELDQVFAADAFDAIFCRNVFIYFGEDTIKQALAVFARVLRPGGILFVGLVESAIGLSPFFEVVRLGRCIAYRRVTT